MSDDPKFRTTEDIERAVRALAHEFKTDTVFIIGSQAILMSWPDAPEIMRGSPEIDAYPENARVWEIEEAKQSDGPTVEASEHIHGLFGEGSLFHGTHGFYISTAWTRERRGYREAGIRARWSAGSTFTGEW